MKIVSLKDIHYQILTVNICYKMFPRVCVSNNIEFKINTNNKVMISITVYFREKCIGFESQFIIQIYYIPDKYIQKGNSHCRLC